VGSKSRLTVALVGALALAVMFGGCFGLAGLKFSNLKLRPNAGDKSKSTATVTVIPPLRESDKDDLSLPSSDFPFVLVGTPTDDPVTFPGRGRVFDPKGEYGPRGGRRLVRDDALRDAMLAQEGCSEATTTADDLHLFRTENRVNDRGQVGVPTVAKVPIKQVSQTDTFGPGLDVYVGSWYDDGDGVPEDSPDDLIGCAGGGFFNLALKQVANPSPRATRQLYGER
jgi:hypothetical protein